MTSRITRLRVSNFRSINGTLDLNFDSPVVLIHGQNGTGKTSLLSAIELGMTGNIASLQRFDKGYAEHLVHRGADKASVTIWADLPATSNEPGEMCVKNGKVTGAPLMAPALSRFYSERCFLAQSTLGRLLEIYEHRDARDSDTPLTTFVKDLLGLDRLDDLIDGLHHVGDKRRLRTSLPIYRDVEAEIKVLQETIEETEKYRKQVYDKITDAETQLSGLLVPLNIDPEAGIDVVAKALHGDEEEPELQRLSVLKREIHSTRTLWLKSSSAMSPNDIAVTETALAEANAQLGSWESSSGQELYQVLTALIKIFPDLAQASVVGLQKAHQEAVDAVAADTERCASALERDAAATKRQVELSEALERANARAAVLDEQLDGISVDSGSIAEALAAIVPYIDSETCPVCHRDFDEASEVPLQAHVSAHIARLTETAGKLQALTVERSETSRSIAQVERGRAQLSGKELPDDSRKSLKTRLAQLEEFKRKLAGLQESAIEGQRLTTKADSESRRLNDLRRHGQSASSVRASAADFVSALNLPRPEDSESILATLDRCLAALDEKNGHLTARQTRRRSAVDELNTLKELTDGKTDLEANLKEKRENLARCKTAKENADDTIKQAKRLSTQTLKVRTNVVRRVFNDSLNTIWRELFVRLAPDEPFVPAFALPEKDSGPVEAVLTTHYRAGGLGGNPRAMLSAGNLNTAALTLFLSLHLSVDSILPWLVIDDPVQSMDEVHIAQFAALLRTLSKQHDRQIIIAVHEKPLFDYLALELSPAFKDDRLITVELSRTASGKTNSEYQPVIWQPDTVFAA